MNVLHLYFTISPFHHPLFNHLTIFTIATFYDFSYDLICNYSGENYNLISTYHGSGKALLCQFGNVEVFKGMDELQVPSWDMSNLPIFQELPR